MADTKLADLTALTTPSGDDILYVVDDPAGTPADRKLALSDVFKRGTVTTSSPVIDAAQTWADGGANVTFTGLKFNATDTASAAASLLMDLQVGGVSRFSVRKDGTTNLTSLITPANSSGTVTVQGSFTTTTAYHFVAWNGAQIGWNASASVTSTSAPDTILTRRAAANLRLGAADAAAPVAQTLSVQSVAAGQTNVAGANLTITGSQGTGTGAGGSIVFQVAPAGSSGTAQNALATALTITSAKETKCAGPLWVSNAYTGGAPTATGYIVLYDSTGTAYKIPAEAV